jgi:LysM repeat protein
MKKQLGFLLMIFGLMLLSPGSYAQFEPAPVTRSHVKETVSGRTFYMHTVQPGQTLFGIARAYEVTVQQIVDENRQFTDLLNVIRIGMVLRIPAVETNQVVREMLMVTSFIEHEVARRETLFGISRQYNITQEELLKHNPTARQGLRPRQILKIPVQQSVMVEFFYYTIHKGETLFGVSNHFNLASDELIRINPGLESQPLTEGQKIRIPARVAAILPPAPIKAEELPEWQIPMLTQQQDQYCLNPELKPQYNVALLIPLYLDLFDGSATQIDPNHVSFTFIQFYQGVLIAVDSIRKQGVNIKLYTFDVARNLESAMAVTSQPGFDQMDLIIGPFFPETIPHVAEFARRNNISVVSPFYDNVDILNDNPNLFQVSTSLPTQLLSQASYIARTFFGQNIILVHNNIPEAIGLINAFRNRLQNELVGFQRLKANGGIGEFEDYLSQHGILSLGHSGAMLPQGPHAPALNGNRVGTQNNATTVREVVFRTGGMDSVRNNLDLNRQNVLITLISGEAFLSNYLRELNQIAGTHQITLFGTSEWADYLTINLRLFEPVRLHLFSNDFIEYRDKHIRDFVLRFRSTFNTEPDEGAMLGVKSSYYFFNALAKYGRNFNRCIENLNTPGIQNPFYFQRVNSERGGWENIESVLFRQQGFRRTNVMRSDLITIP